MPVYPCTYRELKLATALPFDKCGISLYLQGTHFYLTKKTVNLRYIPVPTGNSTNGDICMKTETVYPCTYRELICSNTF